MRMFRPFYEFDGGKNDDDDAADVDVLPLLMMTDIIQQRKIYSMFVYCLLAGFYIFAIHTHTYSTYILLIHFLILYIFFSSQL